MARKKLEYTEQELNRQTNYVIVIAGDAGTSAALTRSLEVANELIKSEPRKKVILFSRELNNDDFKKIPPTLVQSFNPEQIRQLAANIDTENDYVIEMASKGLKNGLLIIDKDLANAKAIKHLLGVNGKGQDYVIHRSKLGFLKPELEYIRNQLQNANKALENNERYVPGKRIVLRVHNNSGFGFGKERLMQMYNSMGQEHGFNLYLSYYLAYRKTREIVSYCKAIVAKFGQEFDDFINPVEYEKQTDNCIYYDWFGKKIIGVQKPEIEQAANEIANMLSTQA